MQINHWQYFVGESHLYRYASLTNLARHRGTVGVEVRLEDRLERVAVPAGLLLQVVERLPPARERGEERAEAI